MNSNPIRVLALFPFLVKDSMPLFVLRQFRSSGNEVFVAYYLVQPQGLAIDEMLDFTPGQNLISLTNHQTIESSKVLLDIIRDRKIDLILQIGAPFAYDQLACIRDMIPKTPIWDWIFNSSVHYYTHSTMPNVFDGMIVESRYMMDRAREDIEAVNVRIIHSGSPAQKKSNSVNHTSNGIRLGFFGRLSPEKNPLGFIEIAKELSKHSTNLEFVVYGSGHEESAVADAVDAAGGDARISFLGYAHDKVKAFRNMDFLVVPSLIDGRPASIMEANHSGVPVLASPVGGIPEMISEGKNGFFLERDLRKLALLLDRYFENPSELESLKSSSSDYAKEHFSQKKMLENYSQLLIEIANSTCDDTPNSL
jgi:glycosyltransferase involved in cell wall biosynthesis